MFNKVICKILYTIILSFILKKVRYFLKEILILYFNLQLKISTLMLFFLKIYLIIKLHLIKFYI